MTTKPASEQPKPTMMEILPHRILLFLDVIEFIRVLRWKTGTAEEGVSTTSNPRGFSWLILRAILMRLDWNNEIIHRTVWMVSRPTCGKSAPWWHSEWLHLLEAREMLRRNCSAASQRWTMPPLENTHALMVCDLIVSEAQTRLLRAIASGELTEKDFRDGAP